MNLKRAFRTACGILIVLSICLRSVAATDCYPSAPVVLTCNLEMALTTAVENNNPDAISQKVATLMFYTIADAVSDAGIALPSCDVEDYQHFGETSRTDKQIGSSAKAAGSTSLVEKPGFARLLGFAVERGAVKQAIDGTTLTLSTSPYALLAAANREDTASLYQKFALFNRLGLSASFNVSDTENPLASASRKQLNEWSARLRLTGDRSSRGAEFRAFWTSKIKPLLERRLVATSVQESEITADPFALPLFTAFLTPGNPKCLADKVRTYLNAHENDSKEKKVGDLKELILCELRQSIYEPLKQNPSLISTGFRARIPLLLAQVTAASQGVRTAKALFESYIKELDNKPLGTLEYTNHRDAMASDYSEIKFLFRANTSPMKLVANAGVSLYNNPDRNMNQERVRDYSLALSLEGEAPNPFAQRQGVDLSKLTYSFSGSYERLKENEGMITRRPDIASVQFRLELPITMGLSIPVAYTYSNNTEMMMKKENKFNIGLNLDLDKLFEITRGAK